MKFPVLLLTLAGVMAGCTGLPDTGAQLGDQMTISWQAYDLETGEQVASQASSRFVLGTCASGTGALVERALIGAEPGDEVNVTSKADPSREFRNPVSRDAVLPPIPRTVADFSRQQFEGALGPATVGMEFPLSIYMGRVDAVTNTTVSYSIIYEEGQRDPFPALGIELETRTLSETEFIQVLVPVVDSTFVVTPTQPGAPAHPLGLVPGSYKVVGGDDDKIHFLHNPSPRVETLGVDLRFAVKVASVTPGAPLEGNEGVRRSPAVLCDAAGVEWTPVSRTPSPTDDGHSEGGNSGGGHADDGHTH